MISVKGKEGLAEMQKRKGEHLQICLKESVEVGTTGFENFRFIHNALPEIDFGKIDTSTKFLGRKLSAPILISSMTGGTAQGGIINGNLAAAAQSRKIAMAVGSQRIAMKNSLVSSVFQIRNIAPDILVFANLGAVQLNYGFGIKECQKAVDMIKADALILHLNPLQEAIQPEGETNFENLLPKIERLVKKLSVPIIVKEVGFGISEEVADKLYSIGVRIVDVAGRGGTNWARIESIRAKDNLGLVFRDWGISTTEAIVQCHKIKCLKIIGSGGIRNGVEIAKAIALGSDLVGLALPFLEPANHSKEAVEEKIDQLIRELKIAMFCSGVRNIEELKNIQLIQSKK